MLTNSELTKLKELTGLDVAKIQAHSDSLLNHIISDNESISHDTVITNAYLIAVLNAMNALAKRVPMSKQ